MRKMFALMTCATLMGLGVALSVPAEARDDRVRAGANAATHARAARTVRSDLNRRQIEIGRMHRLEANRAVRHRATSGSAGSASVASCAYEFRRWRRSGSIHWRNRYYACAN